MIENIFQNMRPFAHRKSATTIFIMMTHMMFFVFHAGSWFLASTVPSDQALVRERAADYTKDGREVPRDLMSKPRCSERPERGDARSVRTASDATMPGATLAVGTEQEAPGMEHRAVLQQDVHSSVSSGKNPRCLLQP